MAKIKINGCRGSTAYATLENKIFGGNTPSVSVINDKELIIFDAGTGILNAEKDVQENKPEQIYLGFSHYHHDHIEGLGVTILAFTPGLKIEMFGSKKLKEGMEARFNSNNFPMPFIPQVMKGINFDKTRTLENNESFTTKQGTKITTLEGNHHGGVNAYKIELCNQKKVVYSTDFEFDYKKLADGKLQTLDKTLQEEYKEFVKDADVLIAEAQFTKEEYLKEKPICVKGWGHSYTEQIISLARKAGVKKLIITHHGPKRTDTELEGMEEKARSNYKDLEVVYAREKEEYEI